MHWLSDWCIFTRLSCVFMLKIVFFFSEISSFINQRQGKKPYFVIFKWQPCKFENTVFFLFSSLLLLVWLRINNFFSHIRPFWRFAWGFFFLLLSRFLFLVISHTFFLFAFTGKTSSPQAGMIVKRKISSRVRIHASQNFETKVSMKKRRE